MTKTPAKFQKDRLKTARGVASTNYPYHVDGRKNGRTDRQTHFNSPLRLTSVDNKQCHTTKRATVVWPKQKCENNHRYIQSVA